MNGISFTSIQAHRPEYKYSCSFDYNRYFFSFPLSFIMPLCYLSYSHSFGCLGLNCMRHIPETIFITRLYTNTMCHVYTHLVKFRYRLKPILISPYYKVCACVCVFCAYVYNNHNSNIA